MQGTKLSRMMMLASLASVCGVGMKDDPYDNNHRVFTPIPNPRLCRYKAGLMDLTLRQKELFEEGDFYALNEVPFFKQHTVVGVNITNHHKYDIFYISDLKKNGLKRKTNMYVFTGTPKEQFYKQAIMFLYMTSNTGMKKCLLENCFGVTSAPTGLITLLEESTPDAKQRLEQVVKLISII